MQIVKYIDIFIASLINMVVCTYIASKVLDIKITKNKKAFIFGLLFSSCGLAVINIFNKDALKILFTFPFAVVGIKCMFNVSYNESIIYSLLSTVYLFVGEILGGIVLSFQIFDYSFIFDNMLGSTSGLLLVSVFTLLLINIKKLNLKVKNLISKIDSSNNLIGIVFIIISLGAVTYKNLTYTGTLLKNFTNIIIVVTFLIIIYMYFKENINSNDLSKKYNELLDYLEKYEKEVVEKRKIIHDYKNQLIVINGYIGDDVKLKEYVGELINEQKLISENSLIKNMDKMPRGLKGLIYYKLSHIDKNIRIRINVLNNLKKMENINPKLNKEILKIIGILLDNAIEALENEKNKFINIEISIKRNVFDIKIENSCSTDIDIDNIMKLGYSTKGKDRGYGMSLIKDILKQQKSIELSLNTTGSEFISNLKANVK